MEPLGGPIFFIKRWGLIRRRFDVYSSKFAAIVDFDIESNAVAFFQAGHASALDSADVNESVCLIVITRDEAEALRRVEELHRTRGAFARQLTATTCTAWCIVTRTTITAIITAWCEFFDRHRFAFDLQIDGRYFAVAFDQREAERLARSQTGEADLFNRADVNEHVFAAVITSDETEALASVEEFYGAGAFTNNLCGHAATTVAAAEAAAAATIAAAEAAATAAITAAEAAAAAAITAAETVAAAEAATASTVIAAAETATATAIAVTAIRCRFETTFETTTKIIAPAASTVTTAIFVETHWLLFAFSTSTPHSTGKRAGRKTQFTLDTDSPVPLTKQYINYYAAVSE